MPPARRDPIERLWDDIEPEPNSGCWLFVGTWDHAGYAKLGRGGKHGGTVRGARLAYEHYRGQVPAGLELDHKCRTRACVNPSHLEAVTHRENMHRGHTPSMLLYRAGVCRKGHPKTPENTYVAPDGSRRQCRACNRIHEAKRLPRRKFANG